VPVFERRGGEPPERVGRSHGPRQAHLDGFDLHANVRVPPNDRARLEHLWLLCGAPHNRHYADPRVMRTTQWGCREER
jgi:hypothetical protein